MSKKIKNCCNTTKKDKKCKRKSDGKIFKKGDLIDCHTTFGVNFL